MDGFTDFKRALCRTIKRQADTASVSFLSKLQAYADAQVGKTQNGYVIAVTAGNGRTTTLHFPTEGGRSLDAFQITELFGKIQDDYEDAQAKLIAAGNATPSDGQIYTQMFSDMRAIKNVTPNYLFLSK